MARPLTHDLMKILLDEVGATVSRVTVTELRERTFFAEIEMDVGGTTHVVSARPSDAVALAVRTETPIFATEEVLAEAGQFVDNETSDETAEDEPDADPAELLDEFKQFLDGVSPDDFGA